MISLRYHIVSLAAAFLALALGIVLGATKINSPWLAGLQSDSQSLTDQRNQLEADNAALTADVAAGEQMAESVSEVAVPPSLRTKATSLPFGDQVGWLSCQPKLARAISLLAPPEAGMRRMPSKAA